MTTTYRKIAELLRDTYFKGNPSDDANFSLRYFAELAAIYVAEAATADAFTNSNQGEMTYANDQFISVYKGIPIVVDGEDKYGVLPQTPAGLPNGTEIVSVKIEGSRCMDCIPMRAHMSFAQGLIGTPFGMVLYSIEDGKVKLTSDNPLIEGTLTVRQIGSVSGDDLLTSKINIPKNYEAYVFDKVFSKVLPLKNIPQDNINNAVSNPA